MMMMLRTPRVPLPAAVWAPMLAWPAAYVPLTNKGMRSWTGRGPMEAALPLEPSWAWAIYRRRGNGLVCIKARRP